MKENSNEKIVYHKVCRSHPNMPRMTKFHHGRPVFKRHDRNTVTTWKKCIPLLYVLLYFMWNFPNNLMSQTNYARGKGFTRPI